MATNIVISPIITEKSMKAAEGGKYSFIAPRLASKTAIKLAVASMFKVSIVNVRTIMIKGKRKRVGSRRIEVAETEVKKAIVQLKKGDKIALFEPGGANEDEKTKLSLEKKEGKKEDKKGKEKKLKV